MKEFIFDSWYRVEPAVSSTLGCFGGTSIASRLWYLVIFLSVESRSSSLMAIGFSENSLDLPREEPDYFEEVLDITPSMKSVGASSCFRED
eukprot:CAMPEP_0170512484 /NCGR_PEP_ID=MMETSP0208-20121228/66876_1 /TAXON_ID=197538 /ORGANISM="Strombidium inclinatum, Strain S3" /LENGTH=90 /DNA_ID=CAMNT_0010796119 /DNA_START=416 /DNA_END=688 /DNA_ORIENTATION=+